MIERIGADILAIQEVDGRTHLGRRPQAFERLAQRLGGHLVEARMLLRPDRDYGHVLWSRWPISASSVDRLPGGRIEPRGAIGAVISTPFAELRVLSTHFGLFPRDRRDQARALAALAAKAGTPTIALGDFNEWRADGPVHRSLSAVLPVSLRPATWPSQRPFVRMDRLYASDGVSILPAGDRKMLAGVGTTNDPYGARAASDHLPLVADLVLPTP